MAAHTQHLSYLHHWAEISVKGRVLNSWILHNKTDFCGDSSSKVIDMTENEDSTQIQISLWKNSYKRGKDDGFEKLHSEAKQVVTGKCVCVSCYLLIIAAERFIPK